jgi:Aromatic-ring-opening dioxygenase LigAB, LigA subunit
MSALAVNRLCREVLRDHAFRALMQSDPEKGVARFKLTPEEKRALLAGDVVALHDLGVNDFMMGYLARFNICGLNVPLFSERITSVRE